MKLKQAIAGAVSALAFTTVTHAQTAGTFYATTGWFHYAPQSSSDPLEELSIGGTPVNQSVPNTGAKAGTANTLGLSLGYFITDHVSTEFEFGIPIKFDIDGAGSFQQFGKLGDAKQWSPALLFKYNFLDASSKFRPYLGLGVTRAWFTNAEITNGAFQSSVLQGPTTVSTDRSWAAVFNAGFNYAFTKHWFAGFSVSYIPLSVKANFTSTNVGPFGLTTTSQAKIRLNPIVTYLKIGYMF
jgi:outer membrane protein